MPNDSNPSVLVERPVPGVVLLRLNRPERLNAMTSDLVQSLHDRLDEVAVERECRVVVLAGAGRGFCAGLDLGGYGLAPHAEDLGATQTALATQRHIATLVTHLRSLPQPVIAAVNGPAAGGGLALVLASDIRLASRTARFNVAFIRVGFSACDIGTSWLLPRIVGVARAQELMLTGRVIDAEEALRIGLVVNLHDDVEAAALAEAELVMANTPFGVALTKEAMWTALEIPALQSAIDLENRQQIMASHTEDAREAMRAFVEKRRPEYRNR